MYYSEFPVSPYLNRSNAHRIFYGFYPDWPDSEDRPFLYKIDGDMVRFFSRVQPDIPHTEVFSSLSERAYEFAIDLAPYERHSEGGRTFVSDYDDMREYLDERFERDGAECRYAHSSRIDEVYIRDNGANFKYHKVLGTLYVRELQAFAQRLLVGLGRGKCYGLGMIYLPEVMRCEH